MRLCSSLLRKGVAAARSRATLSASPYTTATLAACLRLSNGNTRSFLNLSRWMTCMPPSASSRCRRSKACFLCFTSTAVNPAAMAKKSTFWRRTTTPSSSPRKIPPMDWGRLPARPSAVQPTRRILGKKKACVLSQMASTSGRYVPPENMSKPARSPGSSTSSSSSSRMASSLARAASTVSGLASTTTATRRRSEEIEIVDAIRRAANGPARATTRLGDAARAGYRRECIPVTSVARTPPT